MQEERAAPPQELMGLFLLPNIHFSAGCTVWNVPTKGRLEKTFQIDLSLFLLPVVRAGDPVMSPVPTLEGDPGSGALRRDLRLPSSLRWDIPAPHKDTSQKSHKQHVLVPKYLRNLP